MNTDLYNRMKAAARDAQQDPTGHESDMVLINRIWGLIGNYQPPLPQNPAASSPTPDDTTATAPPPEDHDRCPDIEFLDLNVALDALDGWAVEVTSLDGCRGVGVFRRVTQRGEELDVSPAWSKPDIYMIAIHDVMTDDMLMMTDFRNLATVKVL